MKVKQKARDFYRTNIVNNIIGLEEKRKFIVKKIMWEQVLPAIIVISIALIFVIIQNIGFELVVGISCLICMYCWWIYDTILQDQIQAFKNSVIGEVLHFIEQNLDYKPKQKVSQSELINSQIIREEIDEYTGEEYVEGKIGTTDLKFSKIIARSKVENEVRDVDWDTLFEGILFVADFKEEFDFDLIIETDIAEQVFENLNQSMQKTVGVIDDPFQAGKVIRVKDPEFEEKFKLIGTKRKEAKSFLTSGLRKKILRLEKEVSQHKEIHPFLAENKITEKEIFLSFSGSKLYITVPFEGSRIFSPRLFSTYRKKFKDLKYYFDILRNVVEIIKEIENNKLA